MRPNITFPKSLELRSHQNPHPTGNSSPQTINAVSNLNDAPLTVDQRAQGIMLQYLQRVQALAPDPSRYHSHLSTLLKNTLASYISPHQSRLSAELSSHLCLTQFACQHTLSTHESNQQENRSSGSPGTESDKEEENYQQIKEQLCKFKIQRQDRDRAEKR